MLIHWQFTRIGNPTYLPNGAVQRPGEDLEAKGLTEYMVRLSIHYLQPISEPSSPVIALTLLQLQWDVTYWTYGCILLASILGDWAWWAWGVMPIYSVYLAWTTYTGMRGGYQDAAGVPQPEAGTSKRQAKMEKRGGQKMQYR